MKIFINLIFILFCSVQGTSYAQEDSSMDKNYIFWAEDVKLVWTDFEDLPRRYSEHAAFSVIGYEGNFNMTDREYRATIKTYFDRNESWSKSWTAHLLLHEQTHFDLAELNARKFRKQLRQAMKTENISIERFRTMNNDAMEQLEKEQKEYDEATNYSMDYRAQLQWSERIQALLKEWESYVNPEIIVSRKTN